MEDYYFFVIALSVFLLIWFVSHYYSEKSRITRALKKVKHKRLDMIRNGDIIRTVGRVEFIEDPLYAPLSGRKCAYYKILVEKEGSGKNSSWEEYLKEEKIQNFYISDGTHRLMVNTEVIISHLVVDAKFKSGFLNDPSHRLKKYLNSNSKSSENFLGFNKTLRYHEAVLEEGEMIAVVGKAVALSTVSNRGDMLLQLTNYDNKEVHITDDPELVKI